MQTCICLSVHAGGERLPDALEHLRRGSAAASHERSHRHLHLPHDLHSENGLIVALFVTNTVCFVMRTKTLELLTVILLSLLTLLIGHTQT